MEISPLSSLSKVTTYEILLQGIKRQPINQVGLEIPNLALYAWEN